MILLPTIERQDYLRNHWAPYPSAPMDILYSGRVISVAQNEKSIFFKIEKNQQVTEFSVSDVSLGNILQAGDLIAVDSFEKVYLLAPGELTKIETSIKNLELWPKFLSALRIFFNKDEFLEIQTPSLVICPGTEPTLDIFSTQLNQGSKNKTLFLPTSPELHLKKALCLGFEKIFEIKNCFRNNEFSEHHQPEFTMLEWYRSYKDLSSIEADIRDLLQFLIRQFSNENLQTPQSYRIATVAELFYESTGATITAFSTLKDYQDIAAKQGVSARGADSIDDYFFAIFLEKIEKKIPADQLLIVKDYPPFQAALARLKPAGWADRMEVYWGRTELANGFNELTDPVEQERRFEKDLQQKQRLGKTLVPMDPEFIDLLRKGMPPAAGIALGVERLFMVLFNIKEIQQTKLFPYQQL